MNAQAIQHNLPLFSFYALAAAITACCLAVAFSRNIVHCAIFLAGAFFCVAGVFILLDAEFLAAIQVIVYVGAVAILILFAVMLSEKVEGARDRRHQTSQRVPALAGAAALGAAAVSVVRSHPWNAVSEEAYWNDMAGGSVENLGMLLLQPYALPFEIASVLLLAAMVGAIVIARRLKEDDRS